MSSAPSGVGPVYLVQTIVQVVTVLFRCITRVFSSHTLLVEFPIFVKEVFVLVHVSASGHFEQRLLVLGVFLGGDVVLDQQIAELCLQQVEPFYLLCEVFPQSLVSKDELLDCLVFLVHVNILHFVAVHHPLQLLYLLT